jgi:hypothetical protein
LYSHGPVNESPRVTESISTYLAQLLVCSNDF